MVNKMIRIIAVNLGIVVAASGCGSTPKKPESQPALNIPFKSFASKLDQEIQKLDQVQRRVSNSQYSANWCSAWPNMNMLEVTLASQCRTNGGKYAAVGGEVACTSEDGLLFTAQVISLKQLENFTRSKSCDGYMQSLGLREEALSQEDWEVYSKRYATAIKERFAKMAQWSEAGKQVCRPQSIYQLFGTIIWQSQEALAREKRNNYLLPNMYDYPIDAQGRIPAIRWHSVLTPSSQGSRLIEPLPLHKVYEEPLINAVMDLQECQ